MTDPRFEIVTPEYLQNLLRKTGQVLHEEALAGTGFGFCLFIFEFEGPAFLYISDAKREDMVKAMKEFIDRQDKEAAKEQQFLNQSKEHN